jgi:hypothetical protein
VTLTTILKAGALAILCLLVAPADADETPGNAPLIGAWKVVRVDNIQPDGSHVPLYGPNPQGLLIFDRSAHYALQLLRAERTGFAANDKSTGTPEEYRAASLDSNAHYGTYEVAPDGRTISFRIEHASFANWDGTVQTRPFTLTGDLLTYTVPSPTIDRGTTGEVVWQRLP